MQEVKKYIKALPKVVLLGLMMIDLIRIIKNITNLKPSSDFQLRSRGNVSC